MYGYYGYGIDPTYILVLVGALLTMIASFKVKSTYNKYSRERSTAGLTGAEAAQRILSNNGIYDVAVTRVRGELTDHYDPRTKTVCLSDSVYDSTSVAAIGVAAHECGHVIQHEQNYLPLKIRTALVPAANIGSRAGVPIIILGVILSYNYYLIQIGIWVFALAVLFQLVTLPVEFNASARALRCIEDYGIVTTDERRKSAKVLKAAALTYVAAAAASVMQLLRLVLLFGGNSRRRD